MRADGQHVTENENERIVYRCEKSVFNGRLLDLALQVADVWEPEDVQQAAEQQDKRQDQCSRPQLAPVALKKEFVVEPYLPHKQTPADEEEDP